ncbi:MAG: DegV family protein [Mycoplasma sp.]|nr:DegV family protein [Mycoplasma sp.]
MKLGIIVDSSSGYMRDDAEKKGWGFIPIIIEIDGKVYNDGENLNYEEFYNSIDVKKKYSSSSTPPAIIKNVFQKMSKEFDEVIYIPLSSKLSSQYQSSKLVATEFDNIHIVQSLLISDPITVLGDRLLKQANEGKNIKELLEYADFFNSNSYGILVPATLDWLKAGGRISKSTAAFGNLLNIIPIISFDGAMHKFGKSRVLKKAFLKGFKHTQEIFKGVREEYILIDASVDDSNDKNIEEIRELIETKTQHTIRVVRMPNCITIHTGPNAISLYCFPRENQGFSEE